MIRRRSSSSSSSSSSRRRTRRRRNKKRIRRVAASWRKGRRGEKDDVSGIMAGPGFCEASVTV